MTISLQSMVEEALLTKGVSGSLFSDSDKYYALKKIDNSVVIDISLGKFLKNKFKKNLFLRNLFLRNFFNIIL